MSRNVLSFGHWRHKVPRSKAVPRWWSRTPVLAAIIFAAILLNNAHVIFQSYQYEMNDFAIESLQVQEAKRFHLLVGHCCRFGFHHPGPAFAYVYALGEALFYDATHLVPTPFNAQLIALYALSAFFFSATLTVVARQLGRAWSRWFMGFSLLVAAWHFGAVGRFFDFIPGPPGFFSIWSPCVYILPFLCFLVAGASVASGAGRNLPLMTLAGCFLVHGHCAQSSFVVPIALLAYGGLVYHRAVVGPGPAIWPWRAFPRQHWFAAALIGAFLVPIVIDVATVHPNNISLILDHVQTGHGDRKGLLRSLLYFLHFGAYTPYPNSNFLPAFEAFDAPGTILFFRTHWRAYGLWLLVVLLPLAMLRRRATRPPDCRVPADGDADHPAENGVTRFLLWMYIILGTAILLTLVWGCLQEGPMYYFNAFFNFAIYYGFLIILALVAALWMEDRISSYHLASSPLQAGTWRNRLSRAGPAMIALAAIAVLVQEARRFRSIPWNQDQQRMFATSMERALRIDPVKPKILIFEGPAWGEAVGVALYLQRARCPWTVLSYSPMIPLIFGRTRAITDVQTEAPSNSSTWRMLLKENASLLKDNQEWNVLPLSKNIDLAIPSTSEKH
ncbi:MAG TPA: hypothetical protein VF345_02870 [Chthoniobacterales bacterium]